MQISKTWKGLLEKVRNERQVQLCFYVADMHHSIGSYLQVKRWSHEPTYTIMLFLYDDNCVNIANFQLGKENNVKNSNDQHVKIVK